MCNRPPVYRTLIFFSIGYLILDAIFFYPAIVSQLKLNKESKEHGYVKWLEQNNYCQKCVLRRVIFIPGTMDVICLCCPDSEPFDSDAFHDMCYINATIPYDSTNCQDQEIITNCLRNQVIYGSFIEEKIDKDEKVALFNWTIFVVMFSLPIMPMIYLARVYSNKKRQEEQEKEETIPMVSMSSSDFDNK